MVDNTNDSINIPYSEFNIVSSTKVDDAFNELSIKIKKIETLLELIFIAIFGFIGFSVAVHILGG